METKAAPAEMIAALAAINPLSPTAKIPEYRQTSLFPRRDGTALELSSPQWRRGVYDAPRPAVSTDVPAEISNIGDGRGWVLADTRQTLKMLRARFKGAEAKTPVPLTGDGNVLRLGDLELPAQISSRPPDADEPETFLKMGAVQFQELMGRFLPFIYAEDDRPELSLAQVTIEPDGKTRFAVTDSFRMAMEWTNVVETSAYGRRIIHRNLLRAATRTAADGECLIGWADEGKTEFLNIGRLRLRLRHSEVPFSNVNLDGLLTLHSRRYGELKLDHPRRVAENIEALPVPEGKKEPLIFIEKKGGALLASYSGQKPTAVGTITGERDSSACFNPRFLRQLLAAAPPSARCARITLPAPLEDRSRFSGPLYMSAGKSSQYMLMAAYDR